MVKLKPTGLGSPDDFEVLDADRRTIGRIMWTHAAPADRRWFWSLFRGHGPTKGQNRSRVLKPDDKGQSKLFIEKAREIGADKECSEADNLVRHLANKKPEPHKSK